MVKESVLEVPAKELGTKGLRKLVGGKAIFTPASDPKVHFEGTVISVRQLIPLDRVMYPDQAIAVLGLGLGREISIFPDTIIS